MNNKRLHIKISTLPLKEEFQVFCKKNKIVDIEMAIEYFSIFGGLDIKLNTKIPLTKLIEIHILDEYKYLRNDVNTLTTNDSAICAVLTGIATGDRRTNSSFKRADISHEDGMDCVYELCDNKILSVEKPAKVLSHNLDNRTSDKLLFASPFLRFWFAFISPIFQGIKKGDYKEFHKRFENNKAQWSDLIFEELAHEFLKSSFIEDKIIDINRYWDEECELDIVAQTSSGKTIIGNCKYINSKIKKSELSKIQEHCEDLDIEPDMIVIFAKRGFSVELKSLKSNSLKLFTAKSLKPLMGI